MHQYAQLNVPLQECATYSHKYIDIHKCPIAGAAPRSRWRRAAAHPAAAEAAIDGVPNEQLRDAMRASSAARRVGGNSAG